MSQNRYNEILVKIAKRGNMELYFKLFGLSQKLGYVDERFVLVKSFKKALRNNYINVTNSAIEIIDPKHSNFILNSLSLISGKSEVYKIVNNHLNVVEGKLKYLVKKRRFENLGNILFENKCIITKLTKYLIKILIKHEYASSMVDICTNLYNIYYHTYLERYIKLKMTVLDLCSSFKPEYLQHKIMKHGTLKFINLTSVSLR